MICHWETSLIYKLSYFACRQITEKSEKQYSESDTSAVKWSDHHESWFQEWISQQWQAD